jgi:hypothetical protein
MTAQKDGNAVAGNAGEIVKVEALRAEVAPVVARASSIVVASPEQYAGAAAFLKSLKATQKLVGDFFAPMKTRAHAAWKAVTEQEAEALTPLKDAEAEVKRKMVAFATEQERIRAAAQARLQAEADEKARREREAAEKAAAKLKTQELREQRMADAAAIVAPVVTVASTTPEVKGQSFRKTWKARVVDPKAAVLAVMQWPDWTAYIELKEGELNRFAARTKGAVAVAGIEWYEESTLASGSR